MTDLGAEVFKQHAKKKNKKNQEAFIAHRGWELRLVVLFCVKPHRKKSCLLAHTQAFHGLP